MFNPLHPVLRRQSNKVEESWDSDDCGINMPTMNHLMQPFWFFSYRISANILTHTLSLSHLTVSGASHFSRTLSTISSLWQVLCPLICLATYRLCSPSASPTTPCVMTPGFSLSFCIIVGVTSALFCTPLLTEDRYPVLYLSLIFV